MRIRGRLCITLSHLAATMPPAKGMRVCFPQKPSVEIQLEGTASTEMCVHDPSGAEGSEKLSDSFRNVWRYDE